MTALADDQHVCQDMYIIECESVNCSNFYNMQNTGITTQ